MVARVLFPVLTWRGNALTPPPPGDHKGPPHIRPTALAPTDHPASCLASRLRLMPITADVSALSVDVMVSAFKSYSALSRPPPIMSFNKLSGIPEQPAEADKSAVCAINRHLLVSGVFA